ncbi:MAG: hypothetical protein Q9202_000210 [Teloschistes flavicans]
MPSLDELEGLVQEWLRLDQDPITIAEIQQLVAERKTQELEERLSTRTVNEPVAMGHQD